jgi:hypothetical protein
MTFGQEFIVFHTNPSMFDNFELRTFYIGSLTVKLIVACLEVLK